MKLNRRIFISIIIPCYNVEEYIYECLQSVIAQSYPHYEVIIVDNNCSDNTMSIVQEFITNNNHIYIRIAHEKKQGVSIARNTGLQLSKGEWIQFLDADDLLLPDKIEHQVNLITNDVDLIAAATVERNIDGTEVITHPNKNHLFGLIEGYRSVGSTCSNLWRKNTLVSLNGFDPEQKSSVEIDIMFRLFTAGAKIKIDNEPKTVIRKRVSGQISQGKASELAKNWLQLRLRQIFYLMEHEIEFATKEDVRVLYNNISSKLYIQYQDYPTLSHEQYHTTIEVFFDKYKSLLPLKEKVRLYLYKRLGYINVRRLLKLFK